MRVEFRKTAQGTEYWDNQEKRTIFVPNGKEPDFEVTTKYDRMINAGGQKQVENSGTTDYKGMTINELKAYAAANYITIPEDVKKKDDIIEVLTNAE